MRIDEEKCIACTRCVPYCPVGAIKMKDTKYAITEDECYECGVCLRSGVCNVNAFYFPETKWPRTIVAQFGGMLSNYGGSASSGGQSYSNITSKITIPRMDFEFYKKSGAQGGGRGTSEMKSNDRTGRYKFPEAGVFLEFGRPGVGFRFYDMQKASMALAKAGVEFEPQNPYTILIDPKTGKILEKYKEIINLRCRSAIIEFLLPKEKLPEVFDVCMKIAKEIETVFTLDIISRCTPDAEIVLKSILDEAGIKVRINGKTNMGLGRPLIQ